MADEKDRARFRCRGGRENTKREEKNEKTSPPARRVVIPSEARDLRSGARRLFEIKRAREITPELTLRGPSQSCGGSG